MKPEAGTVQAIFYSQKSNPLFKNPVLQITALTKFSLGLQNKDRYKANLSDGNYYMKAVFSSELSKKIDEGTIKRYFFVRLEDFAVRAKENNSYLYVQSFSEYEENDSEYGKAVNIASGKQSLDPSGNSRQEDEAKENKKIPTPPSNNLEKKSDVLSNQKERAIFTEQTQKKVKCDDAVDNGITEIKRIFPHKKNMSFKGRVVSKSEIRKFNTQKGESRVFSFEVADKTGQIKCVAFSENVDIFYPLIENNSVYLISNGTVKLANKKFSNSTSDFEIQLEKHSEIQKVEDSDMPKYIFKFVKISDLSLCSNLIDFVGVVKDVYPSNKIINKTTGKESIKRDIVVVDQTGHCRLTIWGPRAEEEIEKESIIVIKSLKIGEYNGINLSTIPCSQIMFNLDIPETVELISWYGEEGKNLVIEKPKRVPKRTFISEIKDNSLEYGTIQASVLYLKEDSFYYEACPLDTCNKKVQMEDNGNYRCERCNYTYDNCNYRYMVSMQVGDFTGMFWITLFDQSGTILFGATAKELKEIGDKNPEELHNVIKSVLSKDFTFKIRSRQENYNGETKLRSNCMEVDSKRMLDVIEKVSF